MTQQLYKVQKTPSIVLAVISFILSFGIFVTGKAHTLRISLGELTTEFLNNLYSPHFNLCPVGAIAGENILHIIYKFLLSNLITAGCIFILTKTAYKKWRKTKILPISPVITIQWIFILNCIFITGLQQIERQKYFTAQFSNFRGKTLSEKNRILFGEIYKPIEASRQALPRRHNAIFITDKDLGNDPWMTYHRILAYHLFPNVSFRYHLSKAPNDCVLLFFKEKDVEKLLKNQEIITSSQDKNYILAIKKDAPR